MGTTRAAWDVQFMQHVQMAISMTTDHVLHRYEKVNLSLPRVFNVLVELVGHRSLSPEKSVCNQYQYQYALLVNINGTLCIQNPYSRRIFFLS